MADELTSFVPVLVFLAVVIGFVVTTLILAHVIGPSRHNPVKDETYESGMEPIGDARQHFDVKFYLVAVLFLVFDVELLFLYPWAVAAYNPVGGVPLGLRTTLFGIMLVFVATLAIAYIYAWRKGVFRWR